MGQCKTSFNSIHHPALKQGTIISIDNQKYMKFKLQTKDDQVENWKKQLKDVSKLANPYILLPNQIQQKEQTFFGGGKLYINGTHKLQPIRQNKGKIPLTITNKLNYAKSFFQNTNRNLGNIHPNNIAFSEDNRIKIISSLSSIEQFKGQSIKQQFLSPQQLNSKGKNIDKNLSKSYGVGLTILSAGILHICNDIYNQNSINRQQLSQYLQIFGSKYSSYLYSTIHSLLQTNPYERKTCQILKIKLQKNEQKILQKKGFLPQHENKKKLNYKMLYQS